ncbi:hypothetical protein KSZ_18190 [Dictyobacter formicarum]|uniref:CopC domain-containing protein n=1 Tax=Dictyobacter formicarum TaxID=2778368 RepID=A0ABQ3VDS3_9CHLR|nr:hypothetical protein KSZ_18190 [Dictyobacter formicarum]
MHASLLRAEPAANSVLAAPPSRLRLTFSEPVQPIGQTITILSPSGQQLAHGAVTISDDQVQMSIDAHTKGSYLVSWQVLSQDTQPVSGKYVFSVGRVAGPWANTGEQEQLPLQYTALQVGIQLLHFLGYALGFGTLAFLWLIIYPLHLPTIEDVQQRLLQLTKYGLGALFLAEPLALLVQSLSLASSQGLSFEVISGLLSTQFGWLLSLRLGAALLLWIGVGVVQQGEKRGVLFACAIGIVLSLIDSLGSHATSSRAPWLSLLAHMIHLMAMGMWVGGLSSLFALWRHQKLFTQRSVLLTRFGYLAATAVAELFISGLVLSWLQIAHISSLFNTIYGRALLIKIIVFLIVVVSIGIYQRVRKQYSLYWLILEAVALIGILVLAGFLLTSSPPLLTR